LSEPTTEKCAYCGKPIPQSTLGTDTPWLMEKHGYGLRVLPWNPQSRVIWDLGMFYQFCKFACVEPMILDFVKKQKWHVGTQHAKEKVQS
jgi:hypothetical protein